MSMFFEYRRGSHKRTFDPGSDPAGFRVLEIATQLPDKWNTGCLYELKPTDADAVAEAIHGEEDDFVAYLRQRKNPVQIYAKD